jgi:glutamate-1-semialdehyde 2,1-aminomutase
MNSQKLFEKSLSLVPGGVHSPVRSFKGLHCTPKFIERAEGQYLFDVDGKKYIDFCMSFGPLILGHRHPKVESAMREALSRGWTYGAAEPYSLALAEFILDRVPFVDQIRFMNSGTEAVMTAIRLARGFTKRDKILKFSGCYHGHMDALLIKAGSGLAGTVTASSEGIPAGVIADTLVCELGNEAQVKTEFEKNRDSIAAVIIEPLPANFGLLPQANEFLKFLRDITKRYKTILIFDEVISGFRTGFTGMAGFTDIGPDLITYGKIIGGGLPVGAVAGKREIMQKLAPLGGVYQAGTLSANPLAMCAGLATLKELTPAFYADLEKKSAATCKILKDYLEKYYPGLDLTRVASLFWIKPNKAETLSDDFKKLFEDLLEKGIYLAPNAYEVGFLSIAHDPETLKHALS